MAIVDASLYVALAHGGDRYHDRCMEWLEQSLAAGEQHAAPNLLRVEVAAAIRRLTGDPSLARAVVEELDTSGLIELVPLTTERSQQAADIACRTGVRGADAIYLALAQERSEGLVTLDRQQLERGVPAAPVVRP